MDEMSLRDRDASHVTWKELAEELRDIVITLKGLTRSIPPEHLLDVRTALANPKPGTPTTLFAEIFLYLMTPPSAGE
jgi:hypothetical protein